MHAHLISRALGALVLAITVSACGADKDSGTSSAQHNAADVAFATDMLQHHAQALSMVDLTLGRPLDPEVEKLAEEIRAAQAPEIELFADWLGEWDEPIPATMRDHGSMGHDGGDVSESMAGLDTDMPGMMTADEMAGLEKSGDRDFQLRWLEMMIEHHEGAVQMARTEVADGRYGPAVELAGSIAESQTEEIETMERLLR